MRINVMRDPLWVTLVIGNSPKLGTTDFNAMNATRGCAKSPND